LTARRIEATSPLSIAEIQADKDQLRAEFAMSTRRLEMSVEQLKGKTTGQMADLGRKTAALNALKADTAEKAAAIMAMEAREQALNDRLRETEQTLAEKTAGLKSAERALAEKGAELGKLGTDLSERSLTADSQRVEMVALTTQIATLREQIADLQPKLASAQTDRDAQRTRADRAEGDLATVRSERATLESELATLRRDTESSWDSERAENALLRERINDVAAEVARLTAALEGPDSPIDTILAADPLPAPARAQQTGATPIPFPKAGNLADRIRALQARSARESASG
jgi:chromosome segregation ATPase